MKTVELQNEYFTFALCLFKESTSKELLFQDDVFCFKFLGNIFTRELGKDAAVLRHFDVGLATITALNLMQLSICKME
jgi:hypothetical protein